MSLGNAVSGGEELRQFLSFMLDDEVFALDVARIREILDRTDTTRVPRMPTFMRGVLNIRGVVVPVIDLRVKFGLSPTVTTVDTCVVVAEVDVDGEMTTVGALVDRVLEVFELGPDDIEPAPRIGAKLDAEFIEAMAHHADEVLIVLDIDHVLAVDEIIAVRKAAAESKTPKKTAKQDSASE